MTESDTEAEDMFVTVHEHLSEGKTSSQEVKPGTTLDIRSDSETESDEDDELDDPFVSCFLSCVYAVDNLS